VAGHAAAFNVGALSRHSLEDLCVGVSSRGHFGGSALWRGSISEQASYAERCFAWFFWGLGSGGLKPVRPNREAANLIDEVKRGARNQDLTPAKSPHRVLVPPFPSEIYTVVRFWSQERDSRVKKGL
jgi:hypothetical protein